MIVVTGASRGLGQTVSRHLIERGHDVFGLARNVTDCSRIEMSYVLLLPPSMISKWIAGVGGGHLRQPHDLEKHGERVEDVI